MTLQTGGALRARLAKMGSAGALLCALLAWAGPAGANLLVHEPFTYETGTFLDELPAGGQNLTGDYTAIGTLPQQRLEVSDGGLDYGGLTGAPAVSGNAIHDSDGVTAGGATVSPDQAVTVAPGQALFWSALFVFDDSLNGNHLAHITLTDDDTGDQLIFGEPGVGVRAIRVEAMTGATGGHVADGADGAFTDGDTLLLIGRYLNSAAAQGDSLELIGYDTADAHALPTSFDPADPNAELAFGLFDLDIDLAKVSSLTLTIRGPTNQIDQLRIGDSYAAVVPEPGTASLLLLGLGGLAAAARARRR